MNTIGYYSFLCPQLTFLRPLIKPLYLSTRSRGQSTFLLSLQGCKGERGNGEMDETNSSPGRQKHAKASEREKREERKGVRMREAESGHLTQREEG